MFPSSNLDLKLIFLLRRNSNTIIVWSLDDENKKRPDGVTVREVTTPMWPLREKTCWFFDKSNTCMFLLYVPLNINISVTYRLLIIFLRTCKSSNFICKTYLLWENHELLQESKLTHNYAECFLGAGKILRCSKCLWCCDIHCINIPEFKTIPFMLKAQA